MPLPVRRRETESRPPQRWEPFRELEELQQATAQLLENVWSGAGVGEAYAWSPLVDLEETDDAWIVEAELPGVDSDDINIEVRDSELAIFGEIKERERKGILRRRSRPTGRFQYRVTLPGPASAEDIDAQLADGVLTVRIPKPEQERPRRVQVRPERG
jgi:HSP20 family protein